MDDLSLFGDDPAPEPTPPPAPQRVARWQTDLIRKALDAEELASQEARRERIVALVGREVAGLVELTADEAAHVLIELGKNRTAAPSNESLWESRDEDTWIDRL